jgi:hypothetical protein
MWISSHGYINCWYKGKKSYEHIKVMEEYLQRPLPKGSIIHHLDEDKTNNHIANLFLCKNIAEHKELHRIAKNMRAGVSLDKAYCSSCKTWKDRNEMVAKRLNGHCKVCHALRNKGRKRDYKKEWARYKERHPKN